MVERAQDALIARITISEAHIQNRLKRALRHQLTKIKDHTYSQAEKVLVWREKIAKNRIGEFIGPYIVLHPDEISQIVSIDQNGVTKRQ